MKENNLEGLMHTKLHYIHGVGGGGMVYILIQFVKTNVQRLMEIAFVKKIIYMVLKFVVL